MKKDMKEKTIRFEEKYGSIEFLKATLTVLTRIIIENGITTEDELRRRALIEFERRSDK